MTDQEIDLIIRFDLEKEKIERRDKGWRDAEDAPVWKAAVFEMGERERIARESEHKHWLATGKDIKVIYMVEFYRDAEGLKARATGGTE